MLQQTNASSQQHEELTLAHIVAESTTQVFFAHCINVHGRTAHSL